MAPVSGTARHHHRGSLDGTRAFRHGHILRGRWSQGPMACRARFSDSWSTPKGGSPPPMSPLPLSAAAPPSRAADRHNLVAILVAALTIALLLTAVSAAAPSSTFASTTRLTACNAVSLRTGPRTTARRVARLPEGTKVITVAVVKGGHWHTTCTGDRTGQKWYRITRINGKSVSSLYGVKYVYVATSLLWLQKVALEAWCATEPRLWTRAAPRTRHPRPSSPQAPTVSANQLVSGTRWTTSCTGSKVTVTAGTRSRQSAPRA